jgi:hypothetical protein
VRSLAEFEKAVQALKPTTYPHINLFRGQSEDKPLLPCLFRKYKGQVDLIRDKEEELLAKLKARIPMNTPLRPDNDWDWLSFGQHYRLPTRLLDWSLAPTVALFFAVEDSPLSPTVYVYPAPKGQVVSTIHDKKSQSFQAQ